MAFLVLNGTTIRAKSNAVAEKNFEHRVDRFRTFGGQVRQTTGGQFREWDITSQLTETDAATLIGLLTSTTLPLTMTGDLCGDERAVMPVFISNDPLHTAQGFRRVVTYRLLSTPATVPADSTANVWSFVRRGRGFFKALDGTVPATSDGDPIGFWEDQSGNSRHWIAVQVSGPDTRPALLSGAVQFTGGTPWLKVPSGFYLLESAEVMMRLKAEEDPPVSGESLHCRLHNMGGDQTSFYPKLDGHIYDAFGSQNLYDIGNPADDLTNWNIANAVSGPVGGYAYRLNNTVLFSKTIAAGHIVNFGSPSTSVTFGGAQPNVNNSWFGLASDIVIVEGEMTPSQRASWYAYMSGAVDDPPL